MITAAQTTVTTSGGTTNTVPLFTGTATVGNSLISQSGSKVGIGTTAPASTLSVSDNSGNVAPSLTYGGPAAFSIADAGGELATGVNNISPWAYWLQARQSSNVAWSLALNPLGGNVGIGTAAPGSALDEVSAGYGLSMQGDDIGFNREVSNGAIFCGTGYAYQVGHTYSTTAASDSLRRGVFNPSGYTVTNNALTINGLGNVGIGTASPTQALSVNGNISFSDGTVQSTAWTGVVCGGDYAESVDVNGDRKHYGPGEVLVISSSAQDDVEKSAEPYSTMVAGSSRRNQASLGAGRRQRRLRRRCQWLWSASSQRR